jgi:hypothetical protein
MTTLLDEIADASEGLLFPSETDAPVRPFLWRKSTPFSSAALRAAQGYDDDTTITELEAEQFFGPATRSYDWHSEAEQERVQQFRALLKLLKARLRDLKAYKVGASGTIDVFVVGQADDGSFVGISTQVVET